MISLFNVEISTSLVLDALSIVNALSDVKDQDILTIVECMEDILVSGDTSDLSDNIAYLKLYKFKEFFAQSHLHCIFKLIINISSYFNGCQKLVLNTMLHHLNNGEFNILLAQAGGLSIETISYKDSFLYKAVGYTKIKFSSGDEILCNGTSNLSSSREDCVRIKQLNSNYEVLQYI